MPRDQPTGGKSPSAPTAPPHRAPALLGHMSVTLHGDPEPLTADDMRDLEEQLPPIRIMRHKHHEVARLTAMGFKTKEISRMTGYHPATISSLRATPMFRGLIEHYAQERDTGLRDFRERLGNEAANAIDILTERLEEEGHDMPIDELRKTASMLLDRAGFGPSSHITTDNRHTYVSARDLAEMKQLADRKERGRVSSPTAPDTKPPSALPSPT